MYDAPVTRLMFATWLSGIWATPLGPVAPIRRSLIASMFRLDGRIDVARRQADARGTRAIDVDLDGRLSQRREDREIGDARHGRQHALDLVGGVGQGLKVIAEQLDRVL